MPSARDERTMRNQAVPKLNEKLAIHFIDTETTGLSDYSEIIEIAIVRWCAGESEVLLNEKVKPKDGCSAEAARINGYNESLWSDVPSWDSHCSSEIRQILDGAFIGGSNPGFDKKMITRECERTGFNSPRWSHRELNTASIGCLLWITGEVNSTGLGELARYYGVPHDAHTALGDCRAAISVWEKMFDQFVAQRAST